ncbi:SAM-dependent methyltransferase [Mycobacterium sp. 21AC1]|uniref:SAM-dependent methyltransferase n=1 Tax=[Mycobacterium] appelbergii TaxID=2939269 RepID=UPI00293921C5|nr:SAM-dependent methyltransferase [Mycobacterium sp. 21AC1]MDV3123578.1 SAM-dependent methyltransferase [Mycobacterium sp. 21AC1]
MPADLLPGPALTAVGVAMIRARETERTDRLYADPWAQAFVDAASLSYQSASADDRQIWERVRQLADVMYDSRTVGVRVVDDTLLDAVNDGCSQIVQLGAGLDTHAFRLDWPQPVELFEVDLPETVGFKEEVLAGVRPHRNCTRHVVSIDLAENWSQELLAAGFDPAVPTCWIDHVAVSLPRRQAHRIAQTVTELSCPGSRYSFPVMTADAITRTAGTVPGAKELYRGPAPHDGEHGFGSDGQGMLEGLGWTVVVQDFGEIATGYGRAAAGQGGGNAIASR